jgi:hypothetical protein
LQSSKGELDLNQRQIRAALGILGENDIPPERLAAKLVEIADRFKALQETMTRPPATVRLVAYNKAMEQLAQRYPDDYEAQVFYALTLQASASPADTTYANQLKSAAILEKLYDQNPQHPSVTHFLIHATTTIRSPRRGVPAARRYAGVAPAVPHARHMPSHIYSMVGL